MEPLDSLSEQSNIHETWLETFCLSLAMISILLLCLLVTLTVISRAVHAPIIPDDVLIVREFMIAAILLPLAAVTARQAHISVTVFTDRASVKAKAVLNVLKNLFGILFSGLLVYAGIRLFIGAWSSGEYYDGDLYIPMWIGYSVFVGALSIFLLRLIVMLFLDIKNIRSSQ